MTIPSKKTSSVKKAIAPKISPVIPPNAFFDFNPIIEITNTISNIPSNIPEKGKITNVGKIQIKVAENNLFCEIFPTILPVLANFELVKKFLERIIDNLPEAKPIESEETNENPCSTKVNISASLISNPKTNETTP